MQKSVNDIIRIMHERYKGSTLLPHNRQSTRLVLLEACRILMELLEQGETVFIPELGKFELKWVAGKTLTHPKTKEECVVPDHYKLVFTLNKRIRKRIQKLPYMEPKPDNPEEKEYDDIDLEEFEDDCEDEVT